MSSTDSVDRSGRVRRTATVIDWSLRIVLAVFFAGAAIPKLANAHSSVHMFAEIGVGHWFPYFVGTAELAGAIGLLVPPLTCLAAAGLCLDMLGASVVNVTVLHSAAVVLTIVLALIFAALASRHGAMRRLRRDHQAMASTLNRCLRQSHERLDELLATLQADPDPRT